MIGAKRTFVSILMAVVLVGTAVASVWLLASAGVFTGTESALPGAPDRTGESTIPEAAGSAAAGVNSGFQVAQPRDPFEPLIVSSDGGGTTTTLESSSTTAGGGTETTTPGGSTTTVAGETTTTTAGDNPDGTRVVLLEVRDEGGSLVAVVEVDGDTHTVGVGDTFAGSFKVVSLTESGGVFTFGDSAFTLGVGQTIFK